MQYILSEEEMSAIRAKAALLEKLPSRETLQAVCTKVCNEVILPDGRRAGSPWGCILTIDGEWYCDDCPVEVICPYEHKELSK